MSKSNNNSSNKLPFKLPLVFRLIRKLYPVLESMAPALANRLVVYLFFYPLRFKIPPKEKEVLETAKKYQIKVNNKKVYTYTWGEGPSILMTHGWSGRGTQFREFVKPFNDAGYRVVSFDGPAHGISEGKKTNVIEFGEVINQLEARFGPFSGCIGHSFGGVANLYAHSQGVRFQRMIMISSPTITDEIIAESLRKVNASEKRGEYLKRYIIKKFNKPFEEVGALKLIEKIENTSLLLIHDIDDREVPIFHPEKLLEKYPKAKFIKTRGLGHLRILKSTDVVQSCLDFIRP